MLDSVPVGPASYGCKTAITKTRNAGMNETEIQIYLDMQLGVKQPLNALHE